MHEITGNQDAVLKVLRDTIHQLGKDSLKSKNSGMKSLAVKSQARWPDTRDQFIGKLRNCYERARRERIFTEAVSADAVPNERAVDSWFAPRDQTVALIQAAMDEYIDKRTPKKKTAKKGGKATQLKDAATKVDALESDAAPKATLDLFYVKKAGNIMPAADALAGEVAEDAFEQFDNLDPRWIEVVWEKAKLLLKGKHKFIQHKSVTDFRFTMDDNVTIAIVGDWGGGNAAAQAVAQQIKSLNPQPDHIIHLGDVYYAGTEKEVRDRFLKYWDWFTPKPPGHSFALNSNHEMYSGGYGYFDVTLKQFKQPASYFSLANKNWRLIGLDTGYVDHDLNKEQVEWLTAQFKGNNPKTILLTHHQLFSAYENTNAANLKSRVQPFLQANQIYGWIWGHEHLCVVYQKFLGTKAICLGNGCFPYNPPKGDPKVPVAWIDDRPQPDDSNYRGTHTFALLTINGASINIKYIDQTGNVASYQDNWT